MGSLSAQSEHKEKAKYSEAMKGKNMQISQNPFNSEMSKKKAERQRKLTVSHWSKKRLYGISLCKYFSWCSSSPSLFAKKTTYHPYTHSHMRLNTIFELKVLGRESSTRMKCIIIKYEAFLPSFLPSYTFSKNSTASTSSLCTLPIIFLHSPSTPHHKEYIKTLFLTEKNPTIMIWWCGALSIIL